MESVEIAGATIECFFVSFEWLWIIIGVEVDIVLLLELFRLVSHNTNNYKHDQL